MRTIQYDIGPDSITMASSGLFHRGAPRQVDDDVADRILQRDTVPFHEVTQNSEEQGASVILFPATIAPPSEDGETGDLSPDPAQADQLKEV